MNRNTNSRFYLNPKIDIQRSRMSVSPEVKGTFNIGRLYPLGMPWEVLPGDTWSINTSCAVRMQPLVSAPMDNLHMDVYFFFVPARLTFDKFAEFMGENKNGHWYPQVEYTKPLVTFYEFAHCKSIADYMGLPIYDDNVVSQGSAYSVDRTRFNGYCAIWNEFFRDENIQDPVHIDLSEVNVDSYDEEPKLAGSASDSIWKSVDLKSYAYTGATQCLPVCKTHDVFTSALPGPQKGPDVELMEAAHVYFSNFSPNDTDFWHENLDDHGNNKPWLGKKTVSDNTPSYAAGYYRFQNTAATSNYFTDGQPLNWMVDTSFTINQFRTAFAVQKLLEREARSGSRLTEIIKGHFGVTPADASLQRPQYLGGFRKSVKTNQILQTSETANTPQGNVAGFSLTGASHDGSWIHSFDEWGYIYPLVCFRIDEHSYQQGIHPSWQRIHKLDHYFPVMANLGEMPIERGNLWAIGFQYDLENEKCFDDFESGQDHDVFGYQEAWYDYRYIPSQIISEMRSGAPNSLDSWHYGDYYTETPYLSEEWIVESPDNVDRVLAVQSSVADQFFGDFKFHITYTRPMPMYSIPGLIDHN